MPAHSTINQQKAATQSAPAKGELRDPASIPLTISNSIIRTQAEHDAGDGAANFRAWTSSACSSSMWRRTRPRVAIAALRRIAPAIASFCADSSDMAVSFALTLLSGAIPGTKRSNVQGQRYQSSLA